MSTSRIRVAKGKFRDTCTLVNQNLSVKVVYTFNEVYASRSLFQALPPTEMEEINKKSAGHRSQLQGRVVFLPGNGKGSVEGIVGGLVVSLLYAQNSPI
ncbi:MAG: hypothetical protein IH873_01890 [Chloroflexi bacterium]|nr:hypothetical protein [Chloroflexota bacterium]